MDATQLWKCMKKQPEGYLTFFLTWLNCNGSSQDTYNIFQKFIQKIFNPPSFREEDSIAQSCFVSGRNNETCHTDDYNDCNFEQINFQQEFHFISELYALELEFHNDNDFITCHEFLTMNGKLFDKKEKQLSYSKHRGFKLIRNSSKLQLLLQTAIQSVEMYYQFI